MRLRRRKQGLGRFALQISNDPARDILNIERAFAQIRIVDFAQRFGVIARHFLKNPFHVAALALQPAQHLIDQRSVFDDQQVRIKNGRVLGADRFGDLLLHLEDLHSRLNKRGLEARDFVADI